MDDVDFIDSVNDFTGGKTMSSNVAPGVIESMLPGKRREDVDLEQLFDMMADDMDTYNLDTELIRLVWTWFMRDRDEFRLRLWGYVAKRKAEWETEKRDDVERKSFAGVFAMHEEWQRHIQDRVEGYLRCVKALWPERGNEGVKRSIKRSLLCARVLRHTLITGPML